MSRTVPGYKQAFVKYLVSGFGRDTCLLFNTRYILCERQMKLSTRNCDHGVDPIFNHMKHLLSQLISFIKNYISLLIRVCSAKQQLGFLCVIDFNICLLIYLCTS